MRKKRASDGLIDEAVGSAELACTHTSLRRAARRLGQLYDQALSPTGLSSAQALLLWQAATPAAEDDDRGPTLQALAGRLAIQISALTHALRPLVRDGLIEVRPDERDRRTKRTALTPLGKTRLTEMYLLWAEANRRFEAVLGTDSVETLRALADRVASPEFIDAYFNAKPDSTRVRSGGKSGERPSVHARNRRSTGPPF